MEKKMKLLKTGLLFLSLLGNDVFARDLVEIIDLRRGRIAEDGEINLTRQIERMGGQITTRSRLKAIKLIGFDGEHATVKLSAGSFTTSKYAYELRRRPTIILSGEDSEKTRNRDWYLGAYVNPIQVDQIEVTYTNQRNSTRWESKYVECIGGPIGRQRCSINEEIVDYELVDEWGPVACIRGETYGLSNSNEIWVNRGCYAQFLVYYKVSEGSRENIVRTGKYKKISGNSRVYDFVVKRSSRNEMKIFMHDNYTLKCDFKICKNSRSDMQFEIISETEIFYTSLSNNRTGLYRLDEEGE